jgi:uncharacterized protein (TIGR02145 family)
MKRVLMLIAGMSFIVSCEYSNGPTTLKNEITSQYLLNGNLDVLSNNQVFRYKGKPGIESIPIGNAELSRYEDCFVLHVETGNTPSTSVSSAIIKLDDLEVLNTSDFSKNMGQYTFEICNLTQTSVLSVEVRGEPNSYVNVWIEGKLKGCVVDIEGNIYKTVKIGEQTWMAENLKTTKYNNGTDIPIIVSGAMWATSTTPGYCWYNNNVSTYKAAFGALYNWYTVNTGILCPMNWHVPTIEEWGDLNTYLVSNGYGYGGIDWQTAKSMAATSGWTPSSEEGTPGFDQASNNTTGFTGRPSGFRSQYGWFADEGTWGYWWYSNEEPAGYVEGASLYYNSHNLGVTPAFNQTGFSVRCIKDNESGK